MQAGECSSMPATSFIRSNFRSITLQVSQRNAENTRTILWGSDSSCVDTTLANMLHSTYSQPICLFFAGKRPISWSVPQRH